MIQDIAPYRLQNQYDSERIAGNKDFLILYHSGKMLVSLDKEKGTLIFPKIAELENKEECIYLFSIGEKGFYLERKLLFLEEEEDCKNYLLTVGIGKDASFFQSYSFWGVRKIGSVTPQPQCYVFAAYTAMHLAEWYREKRYCGVCGENLHPDSYERAMVCAHCGKKYYPRINPAVIVGVKNGNQLLLTKYREGYRHNALVAGFCEIGETLEETVEREVYEETGIHIKNITYYKSQPWGIAGDLLAGFFCEVDGDTKIRMDENELKYAEWVAREEIILQPSEYSLTNEMMKRFKEGRV